MSDSARTITWAGGTHIFDLNHKDALLRMQVIGLPGQYGNTPAACFRRFEEGVYSISDVERVIEWGLIGGGTASCVATKIVHDHVRGKPLGSSALLAMNVLTALFFGADHADANA